MLLLLRHLLIGHHLLASVVQDLLDVLHVNTIFKNQIPKLLNRNNYSIL
jgi:hypothetical protein